MIALIISSLVFFSLRAMSGEVGESLKPVCEATASTQSRAAKVVVIDTKADSEKPAPVANGQSK